jgi:hypothetical protein
MRYSSNLLQLVLLIAVVLFTTSCEKALNLKEPRSNKAAVFEELWNVIDQRYALFSEKNVDWNTVHQQFYSKISDEMDNESFFDVLNDMLDSLKDGHIALHTASASHIYDGFYNLYPKNFNYNNILNNYLHNDFKTNGPLLFKITDGVGYIYYKSFSEDLTATQLNSVIDEMKDTKGLIIDVRNNTGGNTANADLFFSCFINTSTLVKYEKIKKGPDHNDFYDARPHYVSPAGTEYKKPVIVLTNRKCFSACNDFVLYMSQLPNVKLFGDQTGGGGSIPHQYILANGWKIQYSATLTLSPDKIPVENGIAPDQSLTITPIQETNGVDIIIESAVQYLQ